MREVFLRESRPLDYEKTPIYETVILLFYARCPFALQAKPSPDGIQTVSTMEVAFLELIYQDIGCGVFESECISHKFSTCAAIRCIMEAFLQKFD